MSVSLNIVGDLPFSPLEERENGLVDSIGDDLGDKAILAENYDGQSPFSSPFSSTLNNTLIHEELLRMHDKNSTNSSELDDIDDVMAIANTFSKEDGSLNITAEYINEINTIQQEIGDVEKEKGTEDESEEDDNVEKTGDNKGEEKEDPEIIQERKEDDGDNDSEAKEESHDIIQEENAEIEDKVNHEEVEKENEQSSQHERGQQRSSTKKQSSSYHMGFHSANNLRTRLARKKTVSTSSSSKKQQEQQQEQQEQQQEQQQQELIQKQQQLIKKLQQQLIQKQQQQQQQQQQQRQQQQLVQQQKKKKAFRNPLILHANPTPKYTYKSLDYPPDHVSDLLFLKKSQLLRDEENKVISHLATKRPYRSAFYSNYLSQNSYVYTNKGEQTYEFNPSHLTKLSNVVMKGVQSDNIFCDGCKMKAITVSRSRSFIRKFIGNKEVKVIESRMYCFEYS